MAKDNLLSDNIFSVKVKIQNEDSVTTKEVQLKPYSFSVQLKLMESGLINELLQIQKEFNTEKEVNPEQVDFTKMGKMIRIAVEIIHNMLPKEIHITKNLDDFMEEIEESEPLRFINWLMTQFSKTNVFLAPAQEVQGAVKPEPKASVAK